MGLSTVLLNSLTKFISIVFVEFKPRTNEETMVSEAG